MIKKPNRGVRTMTDAPPGSVDILFDYLPLLEKPCLAALEPNGKQKEVAIIGAGAAGMFAAHLLLKMGITPTIYEASDRAGGRLYTKYFNYHSDKGRAYAELGAMRIPKSSRIFRYYADLLGLKLFDIFPNPGQVDTLINFANKNYLWKAHRKMPQPFGEMSALWAQFMQPIRDQMHHALASENKEKLVQLWQSYIDQFAKKSFFTVLNEHSPLANNQTMIHLFGSTGFGHGGFQSLYFISFLELLRVLINGYMEENAFVEGGISQFIDKLYTYPVKTEQGEVSLNQVTKIQYHTPILSFDYNAQTQKPIVRGRNERTKETFQKEYDAVIYTGTSFAAHLLNLSMVSTNGHSIFSPKVQLAIRNAHMIASSKMFILTEDKFWIKEKMPQCILTDELPKAIYFLDYPSIDEGLICLSYTWGMDSIKLNAVDPSHLLIMLMRSLEKIHPGLAQKIRPIEGQFMHIHWVNEKYQNGAFNLMMPGNDHLQHALYFQFQSVLTPEDKGVYLAGDSVSWSGGWAEGALYTAINAVCAVAHRLGGTLIHPNPLEQPQNQFRY